MIESSDGVFNNSSVYMTDGIVLSKRYIKTNLIFSAETSSNYEKMRLETLIIINENAVMKRDARRMALN